MLLWWWCSFKMIKWKLPSRGLGFWGLKGTLAWDFWPLVFSWTHSTSALESHPKIISKIFSFSRRYLQNKGFFVPISGSRKSADFQVLSPRNHRFPGSNTQQLWKVKYFLFFMCLFVLTFGWFPGLVTRKSINFRVTIPGNWSISGHCYLEIENIFVNIFAKTKYFWKYFRILL
jgi:hypothetical protein